jgi:heme a synthase
MNKKFRNFVIFTTIYNIFVIIWGAFVRATGSGAGCGRHWPLCNGEVIPMANSLHTQIEFFHRLTSGLSLPLVLWISYHGLKIFPKNSAGRGFSLIAGVSIIVEALIGAGLVLFELVSHNQSLKRTISMALHFSNTLVLMASLVLLACFTLRGSNHQYFWKHHSLRRPVIMFTTLFAALGMAGAITALGDTLFPAQSLSQGFQADWDVASHFLVRLRIIHPILALTFVLFFAPWAHSLMHQLKSSEIFIRGRLAITLLVINIFLGTLNLYWLAPVGLQLIHLFFGVLVWISFIIFIEGLLSHRADHIQSLQTQTSTQGLEYKKN